MEALLGPDTVDAMSLPTLLLPLTLPHDDEISADEGFSQLTRFVPLKREGIKKWKMNLLPAASRENLSGSCGHI